MVAAAGFGHGVSETLGATYTAGSSAVGTTVTASGSTNTKGSWASLGTPTFDYNMIAVSVFQTAASDKMFDIGINDGSGNWHVIAEDLRFPGPKYADLGLFYTLPLRVKAGKAVGMRVQASSASHVLNCTITGFSKAPLNADGYSRMIRLQTAVTTSRGTAIDAGATANTKSGWVELNSSVSTDVDALYASIGFNGDTGRTANATALMDLGIGSAGNEYVIVPNLFIRWTTTTDGPMQIIGTLPVPVKNATRLVARLACSDATAGDRTLDLAVHGFIA